MSKSLGNTVAPQDVIDRYGAEILRLWAASEDYTQDIRLSETILGQFAEAYRRVRNTCRFLLGNLHDFDPARDAVPDAALEGLDRWAMLRLHRVIERVRPSYERYEFHLAFQALHHFCAVDLSALYLDILKDRLYTSAPTAPGRRAAQTVCHRILDALVRLMAPILTFTAEEVWDHMTAPGKAASVHLTDFPAVEPAWLDTALEGRWEMLLRVRGEVARALEQARAAKLIGAALDARVTIFVDGRELSQALGAFGDSLLRDVFLVSEVERVAGGPPPGLASGAVAGLAVEVARAHGAKCARCWMWTPAVGQDREYRDLCARCLPVIRAGAG